MANSDKNIKITPNIGATSVPVIEFVGQGSQSMFLRVLDGSTASLAFEASEGQLFSITNNLSQGTIFSVNDISGIPFIELDASGTVSLNRFTGNTGIGTGAPTTKLEVAGTISGSNLFTNRITASSITSANIVTTTLTASTANITTLTNTNLSTTQITASSSIQGTAFISTVATGTPPLTVSSTTLVTNLNADTVDGLHSSSFVASVADYYINADVGALVDTTQYWILCTNAANNDVNGTLIIDRTTSHYQAAKLDIIITSNNVGIQAASLVTNQAVQEFELYDLVSFTYDGTSYVGIRYKGNMFPKTTSRFTGYLINSGGNTFFPVAGASASGVSVLSTARSRHTFTGLVGIGVKSPSERLVVAGNILAEDGQIHVGNVSGDSWTRIQHTSSDAYGFNWTHDNATVIVNEQGSTNQALVLGDTNTSSVDSGGLFGISYSVNSGISWTPKLNLYGSGDLYVGSTGSSLVWNADNDGTGSTLDADLLDGQHGTYYLDYTNITNKPTISNVTINVNSGAGLTGSGSFTLNQTTTASITISHADTSTVADVATASGVFVSGLTFDTYGHVIGVNTGSGGGSAFGTISVSGQNALVAASSNDILTVAAGTNITLSTDDITKTLTINASSGGTAASAFGVISIAGQDTVSADDPGDTLTFVAGNGIILTSSATIDFITIGTNATSSNVNSALVSRDLNGGFSTSNIEVTTLTSSNISSNILTSSTINATILTASNINAITITASRLNVTAQTSVVNLSINGFVTFSGFAGGDAMNLNNSGIIGVNSLAFADPGPNEGISWTGGNLWKIYESPNDLVTNGAGNLQFVRDSTRVFTIYTGSNLVEAIGLISSSHLITTRITASSINVTGNISASSLTSSFVNTINITSSNIFVNNLTASSNIYVGIGSTTIPSLAAINDTNTGIYFPTADTIGVVSGGVERMRLDSNGNLGLLYTPASWSNSFIALQIRGASGMYANGPNNLNIATNVNGGVDGGGSGGTYGSTNPAARYQQILGRHSWYAAPSGSAGSAITFTEIARLDSSGNFGLGTTNASQKLEVVGAVSATAFISTVASGTPPFTVSSTTAVVNLNSDLLDGEHGTYYLDYNNLNNKPTISNATVSIASGTGLTGSGSFTLNQSDQLLLPDSGLYPSEGLSPSGLISLIISHADTSNIENITIQNNDALSGLTFDSFGHVLSATTSSFKITGFTSTNTSSWASTTAGGFSFKKDVAISGVTINDYPEIAFDLSTYTIAQNALISYVETYNGGISLYSVSVPTGTVNFDYIILKG